MKPVGDATLEESGNYLYYDIPGFQVIVQKAPLFYSVVAGSTELIRRQPLPHIWAPGYIQSRFVYENETEAFINLNFTTAGYFSYTWNELFPGNLPGGAYLLRIMIPGGKSSD